MPLSRVWTSRPPETVLAARPGMRGSGRPPVESSRRFGLRAMTALAASLTDGAMITSVKSLTISSAVSASSSWLSAMMPPKAEVESQASARR
ncbi:hypothetical protein D9M69_655920 [compost metagenome]